MQLINTREIWRILLRNHTGTESFGTGTLVSCSSRQPELWNKVKRASLFSEDGIAQYAHLYTYVASVLVDEKQGIQGWSMLFDYQKDRCSYAIGTFGVYIEPSYRGKGLGRACVRHLLQTTNASLDLTDSKLNRTALLVEDRIVPWVKEMSFLPIVSRNDDNNCGAELYSCLWTEAYHFARKLHRRAKLKVA